MTGLTIVGLDSTTNSFKTEKVRVFYIIIIINILFSLKIVV